MGRSGRWHYGLNAGHDAAGEQAKKQRRLSPEAIIEAAIRLADAEGLEAVSIRRVAAELDSRAMSLYDHFAASASKLAKQMAWAFATLPLEPASRQASGKG